MQKGVTLIALVVTVVILLILAGITINVLIGENGIITITSNTKKEVEEINLNTQLTKNEILAEVEDEMPEQIESDANFSPNGGKFALPTGSSVATIKTNVNVSNIITGFEKVEYAWSNSNTLSPNSEEWTLLANTSIIAELTKTDANQGSNYLWIKCTDLTGEKQDKTIVSNNFKVQECIISLTENITQWTNQNVTVMATYEDNLTYNKTLTVDGTMDTDYTISGTTSAIIKTNGKKVTASATDSVGNKVTKTLTVNNIDRLSPKVTFSINGSNTYKKSQSTNVNVEDIGNSGVDTNSLKYKWTQSTTEPEENTFSSTFTNGKTITLSGETGNNWYLWILAKDMTGNRTIISSNAFYLDNKGPTITVATAGTETTYSDNIKIQATDDSKITSYGISTSDSAQPTTWIDTKAVDTANVPVKVEKLWSRIDNLANEGKTSLNTTIGNITSNGTYYIWTKDELGNISSKSVVVDKVDKTAPTISSLTASNTAWTNNDVNITVNASDSESGLYTDSPYGWNSNTTFTKDATYSVSENGTYTAYVRNAIGNISQKDITVSNIDKTAPTVQFGTNGNSTWEKSVGTKITITDTGGSGFVSSSLKYQWTQSTTAPAASSFTTATSSGSTITKSDGEGAWYLWIYVKDGAGNITTTRTQRFNLDNVGPKCTSAEVKNVTTSGYDVYVYGVSDAGSGINRVQFPTWTNYNGQDDLVSSWSTNTAVKGTNQGNGTWYFRVNTSAHNYEGGTYNTHIYGIDNMGTSQYLTGVTATVPAIIYLYNGESTLPPSVFSRDKYCAAIEGNYHLRLWDKGTITFTKELDFSKINNIYITAATGYDGWASTYSVGYTTSTSIRDLANLIKDEPTNASSSSRKESKFDVSGIKTKGYLQLYAKSTTAWSINFYQIRLEN